MAHKPTTFLLNEKKKVINIFTNVEKVEAEQELINFYLSHGYTPKLGEKKISKTIKEMQEELKEDPDTLKAFDAAYAKKVDSKKVSFGETGFAEACNIYNAWIKKKKAKEKEKEKE